METTKLTKSRPTFTNVSADTLNQEERKVTRAKAIHQAAQDHFANRIFGGDVTTKVAKAMLLGAGALFIVAFVLPNPVTWIAAITIEVLIIALIAIQITRIVVDKNAATQINQTFGEEAPSVSFRQMAEFHFTSWKRLGKKNFDNVHKTKSDAKIFLGALPNKNDPIFQGATMDFGAILSINEPWERYPFAHSVPFSREDWEDSEITYHSIDALDHMYLDFDQLNAAADFIDNQLKDGKNVYVHCKAGVGRSAMAVAAYLIKYEKMTPEGAAEQIKKNRPTATIKTKLDDHPKKGAGLKAYAQHLEDQKNVS